jgi:ATP-dependent Clp protease ATP-binding subunit ClpX
MEAVMLDLMYRVPSDETISRCVIDKAMVEKNLKLDGEEILGLDQPEDRREGLAS